MAAPDAAWWPLKFSHANATGDVGSAVVGRFPCEVTILEFRGPHHQFRRRYSIIFAGEKPTARVDTLIEVRAILLDHFSPNPYGFDNSQE
jgi:hypothetical protein